MINLPDYFARALCFVILLADVAGFIIEQAMGISHPSHSTKENTKHKILLFHKRLPDRVTYMVSSPRGFFTAV
jgi:hypothetical protein